MSRRLTPAERLAATAKDARLADIVARAGDWDRFLVEQAVYAYGLTAGEFSCNDLREVLPELSHGFLEHTDRMVPSTSPDTHGHRIAVWRLSVKGRAVAAARSTTAPAEGRAA